jgi:hypothetical protein
VKLDKLFQGLMNGLVRKLVYRHIFLLVLWYWREKVYHHRNFVVLSTFEALGMGNGFYWDELGF